MAMNGTTLGDEIAALIISSDAPAEMRARIKAQWERIGSVIVKHIQDNAKVTVAAGISVSTTGTSQAQTGATTTTGTGTIS
ncbi:MAG: hypothetical protein IJP62_13815 [Treponema sp.]|nr:hypothetical protein [Clostridia bacterium]MBQ6782282.1 hypothetical protein [Treponema sp.]